MLCLSVLAMAQTRTPVKKKSVSAKKTIAKVVKPVLDTTKINDSVAVMFPIKKDGKFGFQNQKGKILIKPEYSNAGFFTEDCNLLNSPNEKVKKYGSKEYASVRLNNVDYRIDRYGKRVYKFVEADLGKCTPEYKKQLFHAYVLNGFYGIIEDAKFVNEADYRQYQIYPQYQYLHILEGDDFKNPMIVAAYNDRFGIIDINNKVIVPFEYSDIKRNFSWKLGRLFEVTKDGVNYFYVDVNNHVY